MLHVILGIYMWDCCLLSTITVTLRGFFAFILACFDKGSAWVATLFERVTYVGFCSRNVFHINDDGICFVVEGFSKCEVIKQYELLIVQCDKSIICSLRRPATLTCYCLWQHTGAMFYSIHLTMEGSW